MKSSKLVSSFAEIAREKGIDRDALQMIIEEVFRTMIRKRYGSDEAFEIIFNPDSGDMMIYHIREVVEQMALEDPVTQIELPDALEIAEDFEVGDEVATEVDVSEFGRRAVMTARQTFRQKIRSIEKENVYNEYSEMIGEIVVGEIYQIRRRQVLVIHDKVELVLPKSEQIPREYYRKGDMLRAVVKEVQRDKGGAPRVIISRASPVLMQRLFEIEVPEVYDEIVEIKSIAREPGQRAKVAVTSHDERVDPVGACVGMKGVRIHAIVRELNNENIDVVEWSPNSIQFIKRALSPAHPVDVDLRDDLDPPRAKVVVRAEEVSQAIGRGGQNIRLASELTGYELDVYRELQEDEEDIDIEEFADVLNEEVLERLHEIGCDSARAVLDLSVDELSRRAEMDRELSGRIIDLIREELEGAERPEQSVE
jgi:N utilization substance protein A